MLERSVKKSKIRGVSPESNTMERGPETPMETSMMHQRQSPGNRESMESHGETQNWSKPSYSEMLAGFTGQRHNEESRENLSKDNYPDSDDDVYEKEEDKEYCPLIVLTKEEKKNLRQKWRQSLIIKLWGRKIGYNFLQKKLQNMWRPKAFMDLVALENDYFLVRFHSNDDFEFARDQGPWTILDHYLVVKEWTPNFDPTTDKTEKLIVWVRIPCLPIEYFDFAFLTKVGEKIGRPIRAYHNTGTAARGRFARICVEVDITKPLLTMFKLRKIIRHIEYEGLHLVCFECGIVGHRKEDCVKSRSENDQEEPPAAGETEELAVNGETYSRKLQIRKDITGDLPGEGAFGPWMIARRKEPRNGKYRQGRTTTRDNHGIKDSGKSGNKKNNLNSVELGSSSRFNALFGLDEDEDRENIMEGNEPNMDTMEDPRNEGKREVHEPNKIHTEAQRKEKSSGRKENRGKDPIPDLNVLEAGVESPNENNPCAKFTGDIRKQRELREGPNRAAAENEHVVVRGTNKGQSITRTIIENSVERTKLVEDTFMEEHHDDPPVDEGQNDDVMMDMEDEFGANELQRGLVAEGGDAF